MDFPLKLTDVALSRLLLAKKGDGLGDEFFVRAHVKGGGCSGFKNELSFDDEFDPEDDISETFSLGEDSIRVVVDSVTALYMKDVVLDYEVTDLQEGFKFAGGSVNRKHCACGSSFSE